MHPGAHGRWPSRSARHGWEMRRDAVGSTPRAWCHADPGWAWIGLVCFARRGPSPDHCVNVTVPDEGRDHCFHVVGGPDGTSVLEDLSDADVSITAPTLVILGLMSGALDPGEAVRSGAVRAEGRLEVLEQFPALFDIQPQETSGA